MKNLVLGAALAAALGIASSASAQTPPTDFKVQPYNITLRGGAGIPLDDNLSDLVDIFVGIGIDYTLPTQYMRGGETFLSFDWLGKGSGGSGNTDFFPICINQRFYTGSGEAGSRSYWQAGLGVIIAGSGETDTVFGGRVGLGKELGANIIAEADLYLSARTADLNVNVAAIYLGYKF